MTLAFASSVAYLAVAGTIRTDGATVAATLLLDAICRQGRTVRTPETALSHLPDRPTLTLTERHCSATEQRIRRTSVHNLRQYGATQGVPRRMPALTQAHRHWRRHQVSQRFRRSGPCRVPRAQCPHGTEAHESETRSAEREPGLPELLDPACRTVLIAHDNRCFRAFWCVHSD